LGAITPEVAVGLALKSGQRGPPLAFNSARLRARVERLWSTILARLSGTATAMKETTLRLNPPPHPPPY
jgi:hypothetical protein